MLIIILHMMLVLILTPYATANTTHDASTNTTCYANVNNTNDVFVLASCVVKIYL